MVFIKVRFLGREQSFKLKENKDGKCKGINK